MNLEKKENLNSLLILIILSVALTICMFSIISSEKSIQSRTFSKIISYSIPSVDVKNIEEVDNGDGIIKDIILSIFGVDNNYLGIVGREISYIHSEKYNSSINEMASGIELERKLNKFTLDEDHVYEEENMSSGEGDMKTAPVFSPELVKKMPSKPEVLIYHTHTCESYQPYGANSQEMDKNITLVGEELKKELEKYGISVIHDTTIHDIESYNDSYKRSRVTLDKYLKQYGDFKLIIDMHRDSVENKSAITTNINGESVARFSFVMSKKNPRYEANLKVVEEIRKISNKLYPGNQNSPSLNKSTFYYNYGKDHFNHDASNNAILMELGSHVSTMEEAKGSTKYIARILGEYINGKN